MSRFTPARADGRSDAAVLCEMVAAAAPGVVITYQQIRVALAQGLARPVDIGKVRAARASAESRLLREHARALHAVRNVGYRVAEASDHRGLAKGKQRRADTQLFRGLQMLKHVRWDEMVPNDRKAHEAQLVLMSGLYEQQRAFDRRLTRAEDAIKRIMEP